MTQLHPRTVAVDFISRREAIERELSKLIAERRAEVARLYATGMGLVEVAARIGISREVVRQDLRTQGVTIRPAHYPPGRPRKEAPPATPEPVVDAFRPQCCARGMLPVGDPVLTHWHCLKCGENRRVRK